jgi:curved DNA-binding protein CbpA
VSARRRFDPNVDYYAILDVAAGATQEEIIGRYRELMRRSHPDRFSDPAERQSAEERAKQLNAAYAVLSRPAIRREYDRASGNRLTTSAIQARYAGPRPPATRRPTYTQRAATARRQPPLQPCASSSARFWPSPSVSSSSSPSPSPPGRA